MITDLHAIKGQGPGHVRMKGLNDLASKGATADIGLVRGDNQQEARLLQLVTGFGNAGEDLEFSETRRRIRLSLANQRAIDHAVSI
jgi:hypothetical protein